jgi:membrane protease YdiL (CAAX protease family)
LKPALRDFIIRFAIAVLATLVLSPVVGLFLPDQPFHRVMTRVFLIAVVIAFVLRRGRLGSWPERFRAMDLRGPDRLRRLLAGAGVAILLLAMLLVASWAMGGRPAGAPREVPPLATDLFKALLSGLVVAFLEEILCRGYFLNVIGGFASAFLYAAAHFFRPLHGSEPAGDGFDPLLAFKRLPELFESWTDPRNATLGMLSLFVFGLALNRLRVRTGTLYFGIGIHAGLVFAIKIYGRILDPSLAKDPWIYGGLRLHDGLLGTVMLLLLLLGAYFIPLPKRLRNDRAAGSDCN